MKVLWICNVPIPEAKDVMGDETEVRVSWLVGISEALRKEVELYVAYFSNNSENIRTGTGNQVTFVAIPRHKRVNQYDVELATQIRQVYEQIRPDVVHVFGTEFPHTLSAIKAAEICGIENKTVVSIQGLVSVCGQRYLASLPQWVCNYYTVRDVLRHCNIKQAQKEFLARGRYEIQAIECAHHVIGRTDWDKACTTMINPKIQYHFNNEILRTTFYEQKWDYGKCEPYRIFMSQGGVPYKGFHFALQALSLLKKKYPSVKLCITERDFVHPTGFKEKIRLNSYQYYLRKLILDNDLVENVCFLGTLNESEMCEQYLKANVYILPSVIENSPNSLGEAMLVGTPAVSADVGGVKNMMKHREEGLVYPHDDYYMLASYIDEIFAMRDEARIISEAARQHAMQIFDVESNIKSLKQIYNDISEVKSGE